VVVVVASCSATVCLSVCLIVVCWVAVLHIHCRLISSDSLKSQLQSRILASC
jgi:hypothetical protein